MRRGVADLPLHGGHVPPWLASRMKKLSKLIVELVIDEYDTKGLLERLADPVWFQAFSNIIGMDWDSSGSTTVTTGILKEVLSRNDFGVYMAGGKGGKSLKTPEELRKYAERINIDSKRLIEVSMLVAKIDNTALQDGYQLYHHAFFVDEKGVWAVVQQGMNKKKSMARRYHWFSETLEVKVSSPHSGISGVREELVLNTVDRGIDEYRKTVVDLAQENPTSLESELKTVQMLLKGYKPLTYYTPYDTSMLRRKAYRYLRIGPLTVNKKALIAAKECGPRSYVDLLKIRGIGPSTIRALSLIAELVYETSPSWRDPVSHPPDPFKFAYAVGGKDGIPFPVDRKTYDEVIDMLQYLIDRTRDKYLFRKLASLTKNWSPPPEEKIPT